MGNRYFPSDVKCRAGVSAAQSLHVRSSSCICAEGKRPPRSIGPSSRRGRAARDFGLARLDGFGRRWTIGYYEHYARSHDRLDADTGVQEEVENVARAVCRAVHALRQGELHNADEGLRPPRPK